MRDHYKPHGVTDMKRDQDVDFACIDGKPDFAVYDVWTDTVPDIAIALDVFKRFSKEERPVVQAKLEGRYLRRKAEKAALVSAQEKVVAYYAEAAA